MCVGVKWVFLSTLVKNDFYYSVNSESKCILRWVVHPVGGDVASVMGLVTEWVGF